MVSDNAAKAIGIVHCLHCGAQLKFEIRVRSIEDHGGGSLRVKTDDGAWATCACTKHIRTS